MNSKFPARELTLLVYHTLAPAAYDGFGTFTLPSEQFPPKIDPRTGATLRTVGICPDNLEWQISRYASGMYPALTDGEYEDSLKVWNR